MLAIGKWHLGLVMKRLFFALSDAMKHSIDSNDSCFYLDATNYPQEKKHTLFAQQGWN